MSTGSEDVRSIRGTAQNSEAIAPPSGEGYSPPELNSDSNDCTIESGNQDTTKGPSLPASQASIDLTSRNGDAVSEESPPPLPPRPRNLSLLGERNNTPGNSLQVPKRSLRPQLQSQATTALSRTDIHTQSHPNGSRDIYANSTSPTPSRISSRFDSPGGRLKGLNGSEGDDSASIISYAPTMGTVGDAESLLGDVLGGAEQQSPAWRLLSSQTEKANPFNFLPFDDDEPTADFSREFDELGGLDAQGDNEGMSCSRVGC